MCIQALCRIGCTAGSRGGRDLATADTPLVGSPGSTVGTHGGLPIGYIFLGRQPLPPHMLSFWSGGPTRAHKIEAKNGVREFSSWVVDISLAYKDALHLLKRATWRRVLRQSTIPS